MATRLNAADKTRRDAEIVAERARGLSWPTIAMRHQLTDRQCRTIWTDHLDRCGESNPPDLFRALAEELARLDSVIEELALLGSKTANDSVKLGALKARLIAANQRSTILRACGLLPRDDRIWRQQTDLRQVARVLLTLFETYGMPQAAKDDLIEALQPAALGALTPAQNDARTP